MTEEIIKEVIVDGRVVPGYYVSNLGNVYSTVKSGRIGNRFCGRCISNLDEKRLLKPRIRQNGLRQSLYVNLCFTKDLFDDYNYAPSNKSSTTCSKNIYVHQLVMNAFRPIMDYPPKALEPYWNTIHPEVKKWIAQTVLINHIDHNASNNRLDNLEYVTPRENSRLSVKHYGGNTANANKITIPKKKEEKKITLLQFVQSDT